MMRLDGKSVEEKEMKKEEKMEMKRDSNWVRLLVDWLDGLLGMKWE